MSSETIEVKKRDGVGSIAAKKLRLTGHVPAILYGHGESNVNLSVNSDAITRVIQHGTKLLDLQGDVNETALLRDIQWDAFGIEVLHVDFTRVSQSEAVEVTVPVEVHGEAPGTKEGGVLAIVLHEVTIQCPASKIPDLVEANVSGLHMGDQLLAEQLPIPEGASLVTSASEMVLHVVAPAVAGEEEAAEEAEPELIRKEKEGGEAEEA